MRDGVANILSYTKWLRGQIFCLFFFAALNAEAQTPADSSAIIQAIKAANTLAQSSPDSALTTYYNILHKSERLHFADGTIDCWSRIGLAYCNEGAFEKGIGAFGQAIIYSYRSNRKQNMLPDYNNNIGNAYASMGDFNNAVRYYYQAIAIAEKTAFPAQKLARTYVNISIVLNRLHQYERALEYLDKSEYIYLQTNDSAALWHTYAGKADAYLELGNLEQGHYYAQMVLQSGQHYKVPTVQYMAMMLMGNYYSSKHIPQKALPYYLNADKIVKDTTGQIDYLLGNAYLDLKRYANAEFFLSKAMREASAQKLAPDLANIYLALSSLYDTTGNYRNAYIYRIKKDDITDSVQNVEKTQNINQLEIKYHTAQKDKEIAQKQLLISQQENYLRKKNIWIGGISGTLLLLTVVFISVYSINRNRQNLQKKQIYILKQQQQILHKEQEVLELKAMMAGEEKERSRLARELHDGIGGMLTAISMNLNAIQKRHQQLPEMNDLDYILHMVQDTGAAVRQTSHNLMPDMLAKHTLKEALVTYCANINRLHQLQIDLQYHGDLEQIDKTTELTLYRIIQELIQNIIKHAHATHAVVQIMLQAEKLSIVVEDDGTGFDPEDNLVGLGLQNIEYRVKSLSGNITIMSAKGRPTTIYIEFELMKNIAVV